MESKKKQLMGLIVLFAILYLALALLYYRIENHFQKMEKWMERADERQAQIDQKYLSSK